MILYIFNTELKLSLLFAMEIELTLDSYERKFCFIHDTTTRITTNHSIVETYSYLRKNGMNQLPSVEYNIEAIQKIEIIKQNIIHHIITYGNNPDIKILYNYTEEDVYNSLHHLRKNTQKFNLENLNIKII